MTEISQSSRIDYSNYNPPRMVEGPRQEVVPQVLMARPWNQGPRPLQVAASPSNQGQTQVSDQVKKGNEALWEELKNYYGSVKKIEKEMDRTKKKF